MSCEYSCYNHYQIGLDIVVVKFIEFVGYSIFVVEGVLPLCTADEQLSQFPVDPALAGMNDSFHDSHSKDPEIARTETVSIEQVCC